MSKAADSHSPVVLLYRTSARWQVFKQNIKTLEALQKAYARSRVTTYSPWHMWAPPEVAKWILDNPGIDQDEMPVDLQKKWDDHPLCKKDKDE